MTYSAVAQYKRLSRKRFIIILSLFFSLILAFMASLCTGSAHVPPLKAIATLLGRESDFDTIIWEIRLPRALVAVFAGAGLALAGAVTQASVRNPMASPFTLGISSASGFGAALAIVLGAGRFIRTYLGGVTVSSYFLLIISSFLFSLLATFIIFFLARFKGATPETIVLTGIAISFLFSALTSFTQYFGTTEQVASIVFWLFGSLSKASWNAFWAIFSVSVVALAIFWRWSYKYNALLLDDEFARNLGVNPETLRLASMVLASLVTATIVSFLGIIAFVCLAAPHIARMIVGSEHRYLIPASALVGANILVLSDIASRMLLPPVIIPVGIITSFLGAPVLLYLILGKKRHWY
ncbi:MAG: iron ABC transporter permease [Hadesarchaea archaeon]|nr:MAG: iron ABC transporter permease [Hadesarchaea archaeon]